MEQNARDVRAGHERRPLTSPCARVNRTRARHGRHDVCCDERTKRSIKIPIIVKVVYGQADMHVLFAKICVCVCVGGGGGVFQ